MFIPPIYGDLEDGVWVYPHQLGNLMKPFFDPLGSKT